MPWHHNGVKMKIENPTLIDGNDDEIGFEVNDSYHIYSREKNTVWICLKGENYPTIAANPDYTEEIKKQLANWFFNWKENDKNGN